MATAITNDSFKDGQECPICLDGFKSHRQLPCLHSFCQHCLQDYITKKAKSTEKAFEEFVCPVCRAATMPANKEKPFGEWASLFPNSPFPLVGKSKVERSCEVCFSASDSSKNVAARFCVVCEEFMCDNCAVSHKGMKMSKSHQIITIEELENKPENRIRFREGFGCPEHDNEDIKFYCRSHETACCGTCSFLHHKTCQNVLELKQSLPSLLKEMNPQKIIEQMRKLEDHLKEFMEMNEANIDILNSNVNNISAEIGDIRKKLNDVLDDIEKMVKLEGHRIYKEWLIRKQEQNHQCQSLVSAIRNSQALLETINQFGSDSQKFVVTSKTMKQLQCYNDQIRDKFERVDDIRISLELDSNMKSVLSKNAVDLVEITCQKKGTDLHRTNLMAPHHKRTLDLARVVDLHCPNKYDPLYYGIIHLSDRFIVLADHNNMACCLYNSSHNFLTSYILPDSPGGICLIGDNEVAITIPSKKMIQFLSIRDRSIVDTGTVKTKYTCFGVVVVSKEEILFSGHCGNTWGSNKCYWSLITRNGYVTFHHEFDCQWTYDTYAALNMSRSRVYISVGYGNRVYCFGLRDGKQYFVYLSDDLKYPQGVAVDGEDNVYVLGCWSHNIHKLSPDGSALQVITSGVPQNPRGICFNCSMDHFVITNESEMSRKLHYFVHK